MAVLLKPFSPGSVWMTSAGNEELVKDFPVEFTEPSFATISFACKSACQVKVEVGAIKEKTEEHTLSINPDYGLEMDERFGRIYSFQVIDSGVEYYFLASY